MNDPRALRLMEELRERCAFRAQCDPPDADTAAWFARSMGALRDELRRDDVLRLETLAEHLTGVKR